MDTVIYYNGQVISVDENNSIYEAILIEDGVIKNIGTNKEILNYKNDAKLVDLEGKAILPGFIDSHGHIVALSQASIMLDLSDINTRDELIENLKEYLENNKFDDGKWLLSMGYDNSKFDDKKHPTKFELDMVSTEVPIFVTHTSGHVACVNSKGLELLGYAGEDYTVPAGGVVQTVDGSKEANGVLEENAFLAESKKKCIPAPTFEMVLEALEKAQDLYASFGITTAQDASVDEAVNQILNAAANFGKLKLDIIGYAVQSVTEKLMGEKSTFDAKYFNHYKLLGGKTWLDGSPQAKTAWLTKPYYIIPQGKNEDYCGYGTQSDDRVTEYFEMCIKNNLQINVHCNGDAAAEQFIRCYKNAMKKSEKQIDLRPVMVHCQTVREDQLDKMKEVGIIPTFFLDHIHYWGDYHYESVLGPKRADRISLAGSALKKGMNFTLHQDPPVKIPIMTLAIHNAVNRVTQKGRILGEDQKLSVMDAIRGVTINGAYQYFEENIKGSIEVGKIADLVILDKSPLAIESNEIKNIEILETIKNGKSIFKR